MKSDILDNPNINGPDRLKVDRNYFLSPKGKPFGTAHQIRRSDYRLGI